MWGPPRLDGFESEAHATSEPEAPESAHLGARFSALGAIPRPVDGTPSGDAGFGARAYPVLGHPLGQPLPHGAEPPLFSSPGRRGYSPQAYERMWEQEQGRRLSSRELRTIDRGCIGITANNIAGWGNPIEMAEAVFGSFEQAHAYMIDRNRDLDARRADPKGVAREADGQYVLFGKLFWSNQRPILNLFGDEGAFLPDPKTGRVDMSGYRYNPRTFFVNFDYGFWDEASQSFWHANHGAPEMTVYQSTKEAFLNGASRGWAFDRAVFGVAFATNYDPSKAATDNGHASGAGGVALPAGEHKKPAVGER